MNNRWSGEILPPEQLQSKLTGFTPGDVICVQLAAVTNDIPAPFISPNNQQVDKSRYFPPPYDPPDSGVESSSSFLSGKGSTDEVRPYACATDAPLVIQYSNLVKAISSLEVIKLGCRSVSVTWSLDDTSDHSVEPDILWALYWKTSHDKSSAIEMDVTGKRKIYKISTLTFPLVAVSPFSLLMSPSLSREKKSSFSQKYILSGIKKNLHERLRILGVVLYS